MTHDDAIPVHAAVAVDQALWGADGPIDRIETAPLERAAAAVAIALLAETEPLPAALREQLAVSTTAPASVAPRRRPAAPDASRSGWMPWIAAAAGIVLAVVAWWPGAGSAARRDRLAAGATDLVRWSWTATADPASTDDLGGDVVWSDARQEGYMTFRGLAANDPRRLQYQLWIFDAEHPLTDDSTPVSGGVFDVPADAGEVVVPIVAAARVARPVAFAVTVEAPGGVVVSKRERIPALAVPTS